MSPKLFWSSCKKVISPSNYTLQISHLIAVSSFVTDPGVIEFFSGKKGSRSEILELVRMFLSLVKINLRRLQVESAP